VNDVARGRLNEAHPSCSLVVNPAMHIGKLFSIAGAYQEIGSMPEQVTKVSNLAKAGRIALWVIRPPV